jgi:hypothetical protein
VHPARLAWLVSTHLKLRLSHGNWPGVLRPAGCDVNDLVISRLTYLSLQLSLLLLADYMFVSVTASSHVELLVMNET